MIEAKDLPGQPTTEPRIEHKAMLMFLELVGERSARKIMDLDIDPLYGADWLELVGRTKDDPQDRMNFHVAPAYREQVEQWIQAFKHALQYDDCPHLRCPNQCMRCGSPLEKEFDQELTAQSAVWKCTNEQCGVAWRLSLGMKVVGAAEK